MPTQYTHKELVKRRGITPSFHLLFPHILYTPGLLRALYQQISLIELKVQFSLQENLYEGTLLERRRLRRPVPRMCQ